MPRPEAVIVEALRTPVGRYGGVLRETRPDDLGAVVLRELVTRTRIDPASVGDVYWGCANQAGEDNRNVARMSLLLAGLPSSVPGCTVNRLCGSSLEAVHQAARAVWSGEMEIVIAGGVESMSRAPYSVPKNLSGSYGNVTAYDTALGWRYPNPRLEKLFPLESMGETAENVASQFKVPREAQDRFALESHRRAVCAQDEGRFEKEIVPVMIPRRRGEAEKVTRDEGPRRDTSLEALSKLPPAFRAGGTVTAGNSSSLNDGAAGVLIMSDRKAAELKLKPLARICATGTAGVEPRIMGIGPVPASRTALAKAGVRMEELGVVELNEAFAAQALAVIGQLALDPAIVNPNGGAIALGHPLGASGARLMATLLHEMARRRARYGLATMCIGVGQGIATVVERV